MPSLVKITLLAMAIGAIWAFQRADPYLPDLPSHDSLPSAININIATALELEVLPGIGPKTAEAIVLFREKQGPFHSLEQLKEVKGIGEGRFSAIQDKITLGEVASPIQQ
jgi:competence protein ComEA